MDVIYNIYPRETLKKYLLIQSPLLPKYQNNIGLSWPHYAQTYFICEQQQQKQ